MADEQYKISLGVDVDVSDIQSQVNKADIKPIPIKIEIENLNDIKKQIQNLGGTKGKAKVGIPIDTASLESSLKDVSTTIKDIKNSIGTLDNKSGMKSLLSSINQISTALEKASNQFAELNTNMNALSGKDLSLNFGINLGGSNPIARQTAYGNKARNETLPQLKQQVNALVNLYKDAFKSSIDDEFVVLNKLVDGTKLSNGDFFENFLYGKDSVAVRMSNGSLSSQMQAYKQYIDMFKQAANLKGLDLSSVTSQFSKSADDLIQDTHDIQSGVKEMDESFEKLKQIFGGGNNLNIEGISQQLDSIVVDLGEIKTAIQGLSSGVSIDGLTQSFDKLSETIEKLVSNVTLAKDALGDELVGATSVNTGSISKIEKASDDSTAAVIQNEKKKQEAYKATADAVVYHAGVVSKLNKAETNGRFYGSNRGTGYFGTGHYFVDSATKHELDNDGYYNKLPYTSVDISKYDNLFKATTDEVAEGLHSFLANLTAFTQGSDNYDVSELFSQFKKVFGDTIMDVKEFGSRLDQLKAFMSNSSLDDRSDSVSTQFMKSLGYEGVDTRGTRFADTRYGTVIYDLKEESILQANITDELQKQGQMLEKINYAKGQAFDKGEDNRIQDILDQQAKQREIAEEFQNSFDTTNLNKANSDLDKAQSRLKEIDGIIFDLQKGIDNAEQDARRFVKEMAEFGIDVSDEDIREQTQNRVKDYQDSIDELTKEKTELQSKIPILEESYNKEQQFANEAYKQAQQVVEQRHQEARQAQESANAVVQSEEKKQRAYKETADAINNVSKGNIDNSQLGGIDVKVNDVADKLSAAFTKLKNVQKNIDSVKINLSDGLDTSKDTQTIQVLERQLESLSAEYRETVEVINASGGLSATQFQSVQNQVDTTKLKLEQLEAEISDAKSKLAEKIKLKIDTDIANDISKVNSDFGKLSNQSDKLRQKLKLLDDIKVDLDTAAANNDIESLITTNEKYERVLKDVKTQLDINKRAEQDINRDKSFSIDKENAVLRLKGLFSDNSEAAKKFASELNKIQKELDECGDTKGLQKINKEITNLGAKVKASGYKTQTFGDKLKKQFSQYSSYLSVASLYMYAEQALRSMFEQVKLIDSAMTELKKVTDETDESYNNFLTNAATRSREIGTTIDGLVSSTADFARLGYGFEDAQGLAEVANIYAVVGDEINGVEGATESLISTMAAFKDEMNGMSNTDFAMSIIDKFNEIGNNFAISSGGIGEALERSASSLMAANNTIDESIALITAANTVVQDPAQVGRLMPTLKVAISVKLLRRTRPRKDFIL